MNNKQNYNILIVDDIPVNIELITHILNVENYRLASAISGKEAIAKTKAQPFDLILLDVMMPDMNGFEVCTILKKLPETKDISIIFITAKTERESIVKGFELGAVDYITKPFNSVELLARVRTHLELRHSKQELIKAKEIAEKSSKFKSEFLTNMSHEIRTPLNGIIGMIEMIKGTNLSKEQNDYLDILNSSSDILFNLINDILDFSKIEAGQISLEKLDFDLRKNMTKIVNLLNNKRKEKRLYFDVKIDESVPKIVKGDPTRINQIILNLSSNAIKFTENGGIRINVKKVEENISTIKLHFEITDTGIGISEAGMKKLFKSFSQVNVSIPRLFGGTGLGLAISKKLTNIMGGEIGVESKLGKGSVFWFNVILEKSRKKWLIHENNDTSKEIPSQKKLNILLVEDNIISQRVAGLFLQKYKYNVDIAENGKIAVNKFSKNHYDAILMDLNIPEIDGYQATMLIREIEKNKKTTKKIRIIAMTANAIEGERAKCLSAGMNEYISKPFKSIELLKIIKQ